MLDTGPAVAEYTAQDERGALFLQDMDEGAVKAYGMILNEKWKRVSNLKML